MMNRKIGMMLVAALFAAVAPVEAGYKKGELLWKCDFTRDELPMVNGTNSYLREGRTWIANEGASGDGAMYVKSGSNRSGFMFGIPLPVAKFAGMIQIEADVKGVDLQRGPHDFNGPKIMFPFSVGGRKSHPQLPSEYGTFDWKTWVRVDYLPPEANSFALVLGLEQAAGEFYIDAVRIYRAQEIPDGEVAVAPKNPRADAVPRGRWGAAGRPGAYRGVMSGNDLSEDAFKTLHAWNANLIRMQIGIGTKNLNSIDDWFVALEQRLVEVDRVLALCRKYGLKMVIDLHGGPGCKATKYASNVVPADYDTTNLKCAWRKITTRYREDPTIYGYDILNEPACAPETWDRVFRDVVKEIRKIDRTTPVITESIKYWYPDENVIYSPHYYSPHTLTHFGVGGIGRVRWSYNNWINGEFWNKDRIREALEPFVRFQLEHPGARIYIGEFSCILWAKGADGYINDCVELFDEYGWDWTYHAFREWPPWSVEHEPTSDFKVGHFRKANGETARLKALKRGFAKNSRWYKGMLHCHCYWSDGRAFPEQGAKAYFDYGYHFYCMSDHNRLGKNRNYWRDVCEDEGNWPKNVFRPIFESYRKTFPDAEIREQDGKTQVRIKTFDEIKAKFDVPGRFLVLPGMEITRMAGERHVHMNYVNLDRGLATAEAGGLIQGYGNEVSAVIGRTFDEVKSMAAGLGDPAHLFIVNHPHWRFWDVLPQDVIDHQEIRFFEVCNCGSDVPLPANMSEKDFSCDRFWDIILANRCRAGGKLLYGMGADDAHWYPDSGTPQNPIPFADGYIQVRAEALTADSLIAAMDRGDFYASCGVDLEDVQADPETGRLVVAVPAKDGVAYTIRFVGTKRDFDAGVKGTVHFAGDAGQHLGPRDYPLYSNTIGATFKSVAGKPGKRVEASYVLKPDDLYVRAVVESSEPATPYGMTSHQHPKHKVAWTQPLRRN